MHTCMCVCVCLCMHMPKCAGIEVRRQLVGFSSPSTMQIPGTELRSSDLITSAGPDYYLFIFTKLLLIVPYYS